MSLIKILFCQQYTLCHSKNGLNEITKTYIPYNQISKKLAFTHSLLASNGVDITNRIENLAYRKRFFISFVETFLKSNSGIGSKEILSEINQIQIQQQSYEEILKTIVGCERFGIVFNDLLNDQKNVHISLKNNVFFRFINLDKQIVQRNAIEEFTQLFDKESVKDDVLEINFDVEDVIKNVSVHPANPIVNKFNPQLTAGLFGQKTLDIGVDPKSIENRAILQPRRLISPKPVAKIMKINPQPFELTQDTQKAVVSYSQQGSSSTGSQLSSYSTDRQQSSSSTDSQHSSSSTDSQHSSSSTDSQNSSYSTDSQHSSSSSDSQHSSSWTDSQQSSASTDSQ
ncbi:hypothetical protein CDIK_0405 [Cucumispora dikerogammari]|nr:hypothetical protein CDIK_0405 [Cucumispora dikerogammari]